MKKILNALFLTLLAVFTFSSCSDVPAPYDILGEGDVPGLTGDGTKENPYNITSAQKKQDGSTAWVQGYIVGTIENYSDPSGSATFKAPFTAKNNLLIAASATETDVKNCVVVQLSSGTILYTNLNLPENTTNLGHIISIQGSLEEFYGFPGVKSTTAATLDGKDVGEGGDVDSDNPLGLDDSNPVNSFSATFDDAVNNNDYILANWYNVAITGGRRWQGKIFNETDKYIQATSYNATGSNFECWFVTPAFKVDEIKDKTVSFKCAVYNYAIASANSNLEVYFLKLVNGKMESNKLTIEGMPTTDNTWVSLNANLNDYAGQTGFVGFKYTSTSKTEALSYRLDDILAGKGEGGGETPGEGTELLTNGGFEDWVDGYPVEWKSASSAGNATLEQSTDKRGGSFAVLVKGDPKNNKRLGSTEITLKAGTYIFSAYFKAATADNASARLGYVPIDETGKVGNYLYDDYVNDITNTEWVTKNYTFTLDKEQKICLVVMNPKSPGKDLLVDDVSLKTEDGGIVGGETEPEPTKNLVLNSGFEDWDSTLPTAWDNALYNTGITKETAMIHGGSHSVKQNATDTNKLQQEVVIEGGKTYRISYWYLDNTPNARTRPWIFWVNGNSTLPDNVDDFRPNTYSSDNAEWQQFSKTLVAPTTANKLRFEVRTYKEGDNSGFIYFDDFEVVEVTE